MLAAFRWNLRLLSYIALVVGAFLIYNTISVSVVRRGNEIGIVRGAWRRIAEMCWQLFLGEAACLGLAGRAGWGLPLGSNPGRGRGLKLMAATVESLYVSSRPGGDCVDSVFAGAGVACLELAWPSFPRFRRRGKRCRFSPVDAMAQGRREYMAAGAQRPRTWQSPRYWQGLEHWLPGLPAFAGKPVFRISGDDFC